jgi:hypothetical protein
MTLYMAKMTTNFVGFSFLIVVGSFIVSKVILSALKVKTS